MIVGNIKDAKRYFSVNPNFEKAFEFLKTLDKNAEKGPFEFEGFKGNVIEPKTTEVKDAKQLEAHRDYLDIHFVIDGKEVAGYADIDVLEPVTEYNKEDDYLLLKGEMSKITLMPGDFYIVFPEDAHAPNLCEVEGTYLKKAVVKVRV